MDFVPGQRLFFWIGQAAKARREDAGLSLEKVAAEIGLGKETVDRFEKGRTRPHELEAMLVGYATLTGLDDPRDIAAQAVRLGYEAGVNPAVAPPAEEVVRGARRQRAGDPRRDPRARRADRRTGS
jgi:transcriptional regulator with XRE-family HTH domain